MDISQFSRNSSAYFSYPVKSPPKYSRPNLNFSVYHFASKNVVYFAAVQWLLYPHILIYKSHYNFPQKLWTKPLLYHKNRPPNYHSIWRSFRITFLMFVIVNGTRYHMPRSSYLRKRLISSTLYSIFRFPSKIMIWLQTIRGCSNVH